MHFLKTPKLKLLILWKVDGVGHHEPLMKHIIPFVWEDGKSFTL